MQYLLRYKAGVNLLYPKIGEIRSICNRADGSEFNGNKYLLLHSGLNTESENGDDVTA